jgi:hypothetical protein
VCPGAHASAALFGLFCSFETRQPAAATSLRPLFPAPARAIANPLNGGGGGLTTLCPNRVLVSNGVVCTSRACLQRQYVHAACLCLSTLSARRVLVPLTTLSARRVLVSNGVVCTPRAAVAAFGSPSPGGGRRRIRWADPPASRFDLSVQTLSLGANNIPRYI